MDILKILRMKAGLYMDKETYLSLALARIERAEELLEEAETLLKEDKYKSANNRAYYSIEKSIKALLSMIELDADSHNGCLKQFNVHFIKEEKGGFVIGDYKKIADAQRIRNNSDYDDFYIADKAECERQVITAREIFQLASKYIAENT